MELNINLETVVLGGIALVIGYAAWQFRRIAETVDRLVVKVAKLEAEHATIMQIGNSNCRHRVTDAPEINPAEFRCHGGHRAEDDRPD